ncbi:hypothetical protein L198_05646 [Cryptococcus wingfieldii CBS 7118]|uniref:RING-type domain-containing protein n=1 Tax=Cryptococcus wingfieldii CBS 7118 TaxID=1295528 RepID=A0A1E3IW78_9TREE|nr:hypothetical protein L198_05646 [Cryptococcus wingfieldii CBS 7118]ODN92849.1 hypothetical protein L198_05646 [Cryptococcus wingfieldii CBS 7118]
MARRGWTIAAFAAGFIIAVGMLGFKVWSPPDLDISSAAQKRNDILPEIPALVLPSTVLPAKYKHDIAAHLPYPFITGRHINTTVHPIPTLLALNHTSSSDTPEYSSTDDNFWGKQVAYTAPSYEKAAVIGFDWASVTRMDMSVKHERFDRMLWNNGKPQTTYWDTTRWGLGRGIREPYNDWNKVTGRMSLTSSRTDLFTKLYRVHYSLVGVQDRRRGIYHIYGFPQGSPPSLGNATEMLSKALGEEGLERKVSSNLANVRDDDLPTTWLMRKLQAPTPYCPLLIQLTLPPLVNLSNTPTTDPEWTNVEYYNAPPGLAGVAVADGCGWTLGFSGGVDAEGIAHSDMWFWSWRSFRKPSLISTSDEMLTAIPDVLLSSGQGLTSFALRLYITFGQDKSISKHLSRGTRYLLTLADCYMFVIMLARGFFDGDGVMIGVLMPFFLTAVANLIICFVAVYYIDEKWRKEDIVRPNASPIPPASFIPLTRPHNILEASISKLATNFTLSDLTINFHAITASPTEVGSYPQWPLVIVAWQLVQVGVLCAQDNYGPRSRYEGTAPCRICSGSVQFPITPLDHPFYTSHDTYVKEEGKRLKEHSEKLEEKAERLREKAKSLEEKGLQAEKRNEVLEELDGVGGGGVKEKGDDIEVPLVDNGGNVAKVNAVEASLKTEPPYPSDVEPPLVPPIHAAREDSNLLSPSELADLIREVEWGLKRTRNLLATDYAMGPCGHLYHLSCLRVYLLENGTCTVCARRLPELDDWNVLKKGEEEV